LIPEIPGPSNEKLAAKFDEERKVRVKRLFSIEEHVRRLEQVYLEFLEIK